jgi:hypothetical protein
MLNIAFYWIYTVYIVYICRNNTAMKTQTAYQFTNKLGYTTRIFVLEITEKSVYYCWANEDGTPKEYRERMRMSVSSFKAYKQI